MSDELYSWLVALDLGKYQQAFSENEISIADLPFLTESDLREMGLPIGPRRRLISAIARLPGDAAAHSELPGVPGASDAEVRQITLVFVDLVGSTRLSNELDVEVYRNLLHDYQKFCLEVIRKHHGHVAQFLGDGVVAYFGYPSAEEDDAERAVLAGLEICRSVSTLKTPFTGTLQVRIGISTGDVVLDVLLSKQAPALGETPNLAARIQSVTAPGTVAISDGTRALLGANFVCELLGRQELKGFPDPVDIWVVRDGDDAGLRFVARQKRKITPIVDRVDELQFLMNRWQAALKGSSQVVMLSGEAGIGKSRLVREICDRTAEDDCLQLNFQCLPYHDASAFFPVITFINHEAKIARDDGNLTKLAKLRKLLSALVDRPGRVLPVFARLLSIPLSSDARAEQTAPEDLKVQLLEALVLVVKRVSERRPMMLLFEDLHWIDPSTEDLIGLLIERLDASRILIVCTYRPEYTSRWTGLARVSSLSISRLEDRHSWQMLHNVLEDRPVPKELEAQIISKTDGVPLFLEEMARMIATRHPDREVFDQDHEHLSLPSTLKDLLRAKIDNLAAPREFVSICAALGRNVQQSMVQAVSGRSKATVTAILDQLVEARFLVPLNDGRVNVFHFRHALIQDAAYDLMLPSQARALHRRIAEVMTELFPGVAADQPDQLAHHYSRAQMHAEARDAWSRAAEHALERSATEETIQHLRQALRENEKTGSGTDADAVEIELRKKLIVSLDRHAFGSEEVRANFNRLNVLLQRSGADELDRFLALEVQYGTQLLLCEVTSALKLCRDMEEISNVTGDPLMAAVTAHSYGMGNFMAGKFTDALDYFEQALSVNDRVSPEQLYEIYAADIGTVDVAMRCWTMCFLSDDHGAVEAELASALSVAEAETHDFSRCYSLSILSAANQVAGCPGEVLRLSARALGISRQRKFKYWDGWCTILHGWATARLGDPSGGAAEIYGGIEMYLATGSTQMLLYARTLLADAYLAADEIERGLAVIDEMKRDPLAGSLRYQASITDRVEKALRAAAEQ